LGLRYSHFTIKLDSMYLKIKKISTIVSFWLLFSGHGFAADGYTNTTDLATYTNPLGTTISSDGASGYSGFANVGGGSIGVFTNNGTVTAPGGNGFFNNSPISSWINNGTVSGTDNSTDSGTGFFQYISTINSLVNNGTISGTNKAFYIYANGNIDSFTNSASGVISGTGVSDPAIYLNARISNLSNVGLIQGALIGINIGSVGVIDILNNSGTISGGDTGLINEGHIGLINNLSAGVISAANIGVNNSGTLNILNNSGNVTLGDFAGYGVYNNGTIGILSNSGVITMGLAPIGAIYNDALGSIDTFANSGSITAGNNGSAIVNSGNISALHNTGTITVGEFGAAVSNSGIIGTLTNSGSIVTGMNGTGIGLSSSGSIDALTNLGSIVAGDNGSAIYNGGNINSLRNTGSLVSGNGNFALDNAGTIYNLINTGQITSGQSTSGVGNHGNIVALTNFGSMSSGSGGYGIDNASTIATLNNYQGGNSSSPSTTALTYRGDVPENYNIGIASPTHYGRLAVTPTGSTVINNFGIYGTPFLISRTYSSVLTNNVTVTNLQSTYDNMTLALVDNGTAYDLTFAGASLMGTQQSLVNTANALAPIYTLQNSVLANSFAYDCTEFGANNVCVSAGGRNTAVSAANGLNNTSALLIAAYRPHPNYRIGAYVDQNLSVNNAGSIVNLGNNTPLIGLFGAWNDRLDGTGTEVKVSAAYGQKNTTITRQVVGLSEPGSGSSQLNSRGAQVTGKYGFGVTPDVIVSPYIGMRYTQNNMNGYTEGASSSVTSPLTYAALNTNATTALAGVGVSYKIVPQVTTFASAGVESDTNTANGTYSATGITGLTPVNFNPNPIKTRPTATLGAYYDIVKNQRLGITGIYRQEPFQSVSTTTVMATYTVGL
jgi:hypothetical protein